MTNFYNYLLVKHNIVYLLSGILWVYITIKIFKQILKYFQIRNFGVLTEGIIVGNTSNIDGEGTKFFYPEIEYIDNIGKLHVKTFHELISTKKRPVGLIVKIKFNPIKPTEAQIGDRRSLYYLLVSLGVWILSCIIIISVTLKMIN